MWNALLDELREAVWLASVTATGVGVAVTLPATLAI
jgi:hypothetical protein